MKKARELASCTTRAIACAAASVALVVGGGTVASAADTLSVIELTAAQESDLRAWWSAEDVSSSDQDMLIVNLKNGILPQSSTDALAVHTLTDVADGMTRTINVYADGSRRISSLEIPNTPAADIITPFANGISGCTTSGGWRVNCKVKIEDALSNASFIIDWLPSASGQAKVRDMRAKNCNNSVGGCEVSGSILRTTQSGSSPAWAELNFKAWVGPIPAASGAFGIRALGQQATMYHPF